MVSSAFVFVGSRADDTTPKKNESIGFSRHFSPPLSLSVSVSRGCISLIVPKRFWSRYPTLQLIGTIAPGTIS